MAIKILKPGDLLKSTKTDLVWTIVEVRNKSVLLSIETEEIRDFLMDKSVVYNRIREGSLEFDRPKKAFAFD